MTSRRKSVWAWTRVAGGAMDLTSLGMAIAHRGGRRRRRLVSVTGAAVGITVVDLLTAVQANRTKEVSSVPTARGSDVRWPGRQNSGRASVMSADD
jgi:hypothetical protein